MGGWVFDKIANHKKENRRKFASKWIIKQYKNLTCLLVNFIQLFNKLKLNIIIKQLQLSRLVSIKLQEEKVNL